MEIYITAVVASFLSVFSGSGGIQGVPRYLDQYKQPTQSVEYFQPADNNDFYLVQEAYGINLYQFANYKIQ